MHPSDDTRPKINSVDQHAAQFRKRPEECQQRSSAWCDLHRGPVRRARCDGAVSECARFRERATWALPEGFHADVELQDDGASAVANGGWRKQITAYCTLGMQAQCGSEMATVGVSCIQRAMRTARDNAVSALQMQVQ